MVKKKITIFLLLLSTISYAQNKLKSHTHIKEEINYKQKLEFDNLFFQGLNLKQKQDYNGAIKCFENCLKINRNNPAVFYEIGKIYNTQGDFDLSTDKLKKAINLDPKNKWYLLAYAQALFKKQDYKNASDQYKKLLDIEPTNREFYFLLADTYIYQKRFIKAINVYNDLEKQKGIEKSVSIQKSKLYMQINKKESAIKELVNLLDKFPKDTEVMEILAETYLLNNQKKSAMNLFEKISFLNPDKGRIHLTLADYYRQEGDNNKSFEELTLAFKSKQLNIDTKIRVLASYLQIMLLNENLKKQAYLLSEILIEEHGESIKARAIHADILYTDNKFQQAKEQYILVLEKEKSKPEIWTQVLFIQAEQKDFEEMIKTSKEALSYFPMNPLFYYFNGISNKWLKNYDKAISSLEIGINFVVDNDLLLLEFYSSMADSYHAIRNHNKSDSLYDVAIKIDPENTLVLNNYAYYLSLRKKDLEKALKMSLIANTIEKNNSTYEDTHAWILYQSNEYEKAKEWILRSLSNGGKESAIIIEHYGDILYKLGDIEKALIQWKKAFEMGGESESLRKKIQEKKIYE